MTTKHPSDRHLWLTGHRIESPRNSASTFGRHDGHCRLRGPFTAAGSLMRAIVPSAVISDPDLVRRYDIEILSAAPELSGLVVNSRPTLTSDADPLTRTRYYPHNRTAWIGNGLTDLVLSRAEALGGAQSVWFDHVDQLDPTDAVWLEGLLRRSDPAVLRVVCTSGSSEAGPATEALSRYALIVRAGIDSAQQPSAPGVELARRFVAGHGTSDDPQAQQAYAALGDAERRALHDEQADLLNGPQHLDANGLSVWRRGAHGYHLEHGSDPSGRGCDGLSLAQQDCLMAGCYDAVVELGHRIRALVDWSDGERCWLATVKMTIALQAMGRPDEAMELFDDACANSTMPSVHMQSAYGRAMVYTRYYDEARRDLRKAKGLINTAVVLAGLSTDKERRAYNRTFNENGLALVDMHLGEVDAAVDLIESGIERLDKEVEGGRFLLHRSVLRYNHAQLMVRCGRLDDALDEYTRLLAEDPHHPDYWFDRAGLYEKLGRIEKAIADYTAATLAGPPYPEPYYNRAELLLRIGDTQAALAGFSRVLDLDPTFVDAWVNRASLRLESGELAGAAADVSAGLALDPQQPHLLCLRGLIEQENGQLDAARRSFDAALQADPSMASAWATLGGLLFDIGDRDGACRCLERSLELSDHPDVRDNLAFALAS